jgi:hypothetical protein
MVSRAGSTWLQWPSQSSTDRVATAVPDTHWQYVNRARARYDANLAEHELSEYRMHRMSNALVRPSTGTAAAIREARHRAAISSSRTASINAIKTAGNGSFESDPVALVKPPSRSLGAGPSHEARRTYSESANLRKSTALESLRPQTAIGLYGGPEGGHGSQPGAMRHTSGMTQRGAGDGRLADGRRSADAVLYGPVRTSPVSLSLSLSVYFLNLSLMLSFCFVLLFGILLLLCAAHTCIVLLLPLMCTCTF